MANGDSSFHTMHACSLLAELEAAIHHLPEESKNFIRNSTATILHKARPPSHKNLNAYERKALQDLKKDETRILMKADKGNCFVVLDKSDYDSKMDSLLSDLIPLNRKLHSTDAIPPAIRGSIKHHKQGNPVRPIVSFIGSALYNTSKFLTDILSPLQNSNGFSVPNSAKFAEEISNVDIQDDEVMLSFDVVSLFTAIPVDKACDYISNKLLKDNSLPSRTSLDSNEIISLLKFILSNNYFIYDDKIYKQIHGCAMGSPVSAVVANLCMEAIEEMAINTSEVQPKVWKRYVDDSFCIIKRDAVNSFHTTLNSIDPHISFTIEEESDQQIGFLDTLVSRKDNTITIDVYRKKGTHTDRYLDFSPHHDKRHKISTAETLLHREIKLPSTPQGKNTEINHVFDALQANNYPSFVISNILKRKFSKPPTHATPSPEELVGMFFKWFAPQENPNGFAVLPFINGVTQPLTRILRRHDIRVVNKPLKTLQQEFLSPKFRPAIEHQPNVVYKIPCADCDWCYIGETGRCFKTRKKEHVRNVKTCANGSNIAKHAWSFGHRIDFSHSRVIDKGSFRVRKTLEAWHTSSTKHADNNFKPIPNQYKILFKQ
ncbi:uncharacterized protein [Montipora capricornis]|uniref:uncharacterized protein n=1 Tax=Montipora capricornis TaxID=246305 RepID=UPI0035F19EA8